MDSRHEPNILELERATGRPRARVADAHRLWAISSDSRRRWGGFVELAVPRSPTLDGAGNGTSAYLLRKSAPAAVGMLRSTEPLKETRSSRVSQRLPLLGERATGRPRICFANPHRRLRLLATNASRLLYARTLSGSSPGTLLKKARHRDGAVLVLLTGAGNGTRTRECQLGKLMPYHLAMPACVLASITRLSCSIQGWRCLF